MKIAQYRDKSMTRVGIIERDTLIPLDFSGDMVELINNGRSTAAKLKPINLSDVKLEPPVSKPSKIIALGLNYKDHAEESKGEIPEVPLVFAKFPSSITGPGGVISWRKEVTSEVDFEAELAVIIGKECRNCSEAEAWNAVFGYTCANDVSARDLQFGDGQWVRGKSLDTFCPLGPWIVTRDSVPDPHNLSIRCELNGNIMQESNTGLMIFNISYLISFLSKHFTLLPGDVIITGTPPGVGAFRTPPVFMKDGDVVIVEIEGIGSLINSCKTD